jgi:hypothetical protein
LTPRWRRTQPGLRASTARNFRTDIEAFVNSEVVRAVVSTGVYERPPEPGVFYSAFLDFSGGSGTDSMCLCIAHKDRSDAIIIDALREQKPPFSPEFAVSQFAALLKAYRVYKVQGDMFGGEFAREPLTKHGIRYEVTKTAKSELYSHHLLPTLNSGKVDLLDHSKAISQIIGLECHTARAGRDKIDHAPGGHDDLANVIAGVVAVLRGKVYDTTSAWIDGDKPPPEDAGVREERIQQLIERLKRGERV